MTQTSTSKDARASVGSLIFLAVFVGVGIGVAAVSLLRGSPVPAVACILGVAMLGRQLRGVANDIVGRLP